MRKSIFALLAALLLAAWGTAAASAADKAKQRKQLLDEFKATGHWLVWSSDGQAGNFEIYISRPDGSDRRNLTNTADWNENLPRVRPNTNQIAFSIAQWAAPDPAADKKGKKKKRKRFYSRGNLAFMDIDGKNRNVIDTVDLADDKSWNPDGTRLALSWRDRKVFGFRIYDMATGKARTFAKDKRAMLDMDWSPDGKLLTFAVRKSLGFRYAVLTMNTDGTGIRPFWVEKGSGSCHPSWHPKELRIAFNSSRRGLAVGDYDPKGEGTQQALNIRSLLAKKHTTWEDPCPRWSPDGTHVAFITRRRRLRVVRVKDKKYAPVEMPKDWTVGNFQYDWVQVPEAVK
jgi:Tol biopolymer transport system component